jgi:periplasmic divalent cation tolerance protein
MPEHVVVLTTLSSEEQAVELAKELLGRRLVACVNVVSGVRSLYRFKGVLSDDRESLLLMKTTSDRYEELAAAVAAIHPYEVPELLSLPVANGSSDYLAWVTDSVNEPPDRSE